MESSRTLVIHPKDETTTFLERIYKPIKNKLVIQEGVTKNEVRELIKKHDRIMMMGHGTPWGLFSVGNFSYTQGGFIIDYTMVPELEKKTDCVYIWCNADKFVEKHNLKGFYSGMFISEVGEAHFCQISRPNQKMVNESNYGFSKILSKHIKENSETIYKKVLQEYGKIGETNPVASYNLNRLYIK